MRANNFKLGFKFFVGLFLVYGLFLFSFSVASAQTCNIGTQGVATQIASCGKFGAGAGYCGTTGTNSQGCTCSASSCSCSVPAYTCPSTYTTSCSCWVTGGGCTGNPGACSTAIYSNNVCNCSQTLNGCTPASAGNTTLYCTSTAGPTSPPGPGPTSPPGPVATSTPVPPVPTATTAPAATPTPFIIGNVYDDPNNGTVAIGGGGICVKSGTAPVGTSVANASVNAVKSSTGVNTDGILAGSGFSLTSSLVSGASDYTVNLALPTPAAGDLNSYVCSCPIGGNEFLCSYSSIAEGDTVNFFVRQNSLANAWWQTYGGNVYARDAIQTNIPVSACDATGGSCQSALIVGNGPDTAGFAVLGDNGVLSTTEGGSTAYVQAQGSRTTAAGAFAVGVDPGQEGYGFFKSTAGNQVTEVASLAEFKAAISAMANDTNKIFLYTGAGDLTVDQDSASIPISMSGNKRVALFVPTNLSFMNSSGSVSPQLTDVPVGSFLMFIVQGNITVDPAVGYTNSTINPLTVQPSLTGVFVANGHIIIQSDGDTAIADRKFIGAGTFVGWDTAGTGNGLELHRDLQSALGMAANSINPAEAFVYRPDFLVNFPVELKIANYNWKEIAPQR